jgi:hypothetical protein
VVDKQSKGGRHRKIIILAGEYPGHQAAGNQKSEDYRPSQIAKIVQQHILLHSRYATLLNPTKWPLCSFGQPGNNPDGYLQFITPPARHAFDTKVYLNQYIYIDQFANVSRV